MAATTSCSGVRAQHGAGAWEKSRRSLEWLNRSAGGRTGAWYEEISSVRSQMNTCGLVPWTSGEATLFVVRHWLGVRFEGERLVIRPRPYPGVSAGKGSQVTMAHLRFRQGRLQLEVKPDGRLKRAGYNGRALKVRPDGSVELP